MKKRLALLLISVCLSGCATNFPTPQNAAFQPGDSNTSTASGTELFSATFRAHGGAYLDQLNDVNVSLDGQWKQLIRRIQPLVTDYTYRVKSEERLLPKARIYAAHYTGPAGTKSVYRSPDSIRVWYNNEPSTRPDVLSSTALTGDAFHLFLLGPLALSDWGDQFVRLADARLNGRSHQRIYLERRPGFGFSDRDQLVLWINPDTRLTSLIQITLEGHETTKGAHVEVEYLDYLTLDKFTFPRKFFERVNAPISIDAHAWHLTGIDINRGYQANDVSQPGFLNSSTQPAKLLKQN